MWEVAELRLWPYPEAVTWLEYSNAKDHSAIDPLPFPLLNTINYVVRSKVEHPLAPN